MESGAYIKSLLQRYKKGLCTPAEIARLEQWFEKVQEDHEVFSDLSEEDEERLLQRLKANPRFDLPVPVIGKKRQTGLLRRFSRVAAIWIGILLCSGTAAWLLYQNNRPAPVQQIISFVEVTTGHERKQVVLPDSSVVWLNSFSRLAYHPDFIAHRELRLSGEAFFQVAHDKEHPFTVEAGTALTKVYGTAFNISAYSDASELRVALRQGSIGITNGRKTGEETILSPGQLFICNPKTSAARTTTENPEDIGGWVSGKLIFKEVPLKEVLMQLERQYSVSFTYNSTLKNPPVTARFDHASLEKAINHLSFGWDIQFERKGDTFFVK
jgi:transmembrane sensor